MMINDGSIVFEIASRPRDGQLGLLKADHPDFGNRLVIDFTGKLADHSASVDLGDTWEIVPRTATSSIQGTNNVTYRLNGAPLPPGWLPAGSHLAVIQFKAVSGLQGLGIRVVPDAGFTAYDTWATANGLPTNYLRGPYQDANSNGVINALEFFFGSNTTGTTVPAQFHTLLAADGKPYIRLSYVRPTGHPDATYTLYYSRDRTNWFVAPLSVTDISPIPGASLERVTLQSSFSSTGGQWFFRIQADFNPENFAQYPGRDPGTAYRGYPGPAQQPWLCRWPNPVLQRQFRPHVWVGLWHGYLPGLFSLERGGGACRRASGPYARHR